MRQVLNFLKKEAMLTVSILAALLSLFITPPTKALLSAIDWKTLATLFMLLSVLDGFKTENLFRPVIQLAGKVRSRVGLSLFLIFGVFFSSMFVTNDVSLIIFVPLTILLFRQRGQEDKLIAVLVLENIAAVRGSLLTPFGSPQNLFLFSKSEMSAGAFLKMMFPLTIISAVLLIGFVCFLHRKELRDKATETGAESEGSWDPARRGKRILYLLLFILVVAMIVSRTELWPYVTLLVTAALLIFDRKVFRRVDYVLLLTFLCFFVFSSSIAGNAAISEFLHHAVEGHEYLWSLLLSQVISNVPAAIVLWPFSTDLKALIYGLDTAGLIFIIGSLASVIDMRLYLREYPGKGKDFFIAFEKYSLAFFLLLLLPQWLLLR